MKLIPTVVFDRAPIESGVTVQIAEPKGWVMVPPVGNSSFRGPYSAIIYSPRPKPSFPVVELELVANIKPKIPFEGQPPP
ncbi:MAG TPA: hypothetical protein VGI60_16270 [Chthoniobacterales bacterium]